MNGNASTIPQITDAFDTMLIERGFVKGIIFDINVKFATTQMKARKSRIKRANEPLKIENK